MMVYTIYMITNKLNDMKYIGFTSQSLSDRWAKHKTRTSKTHFSKTIRESGPDNFHIEVLDTKTDLIEAMMCELENIKKYNSLYPVGYNRLYTEAAKSQIGDKQRGIKKSKLHKQAVSRGLTGLKQSEFTINKRARKLDKSIVDQNGIIYTSITHASRELNIPHSSISRLLLGITKAGNHGYAFKFINTGVV